MDRRRTTHDPRRLPVGRVAPWILATAVLGCGGDDDAAATSIGTGWVGSSSGAPPSTSGPDDTSGSDAAGTTGVGTTGADTSSTADASTEDSTGVPPPVDACAEQAPTCPAQTDAVEHGGLVEIDRCGFPLDDQSTDADADAIIQALAQTLPVVGFDVLVGDLNRDVSVVDSVPGSPAGLAYGFVWDDSENDKAYWIPQGITGSADADDTGLVAGRRMIAVSWYYDIDLHAGSTGEKGVRISWVDVTDPAAPSYRMALLVEPSGTPDAPDFAPVVIHAGGIAWVGDRLWVADTGHGFRVFDLSRIMQVATDEDVVGCTGAVCRGGLYKYIVPQIGRAEHDSRCGPRFSFVALDRGADGLALVSGEYCSDTACDGPLAGRLFRWPLADGGDRLRSDRVWPTAAWLMGQRQVQGAALFDGVAYLSSSAPAGGAGELYRAVPGASGRSDWSDTPEDLMVDANAGWLWSLSEVEGARYVYASELDALPAP